MGICQKASSPWASPLHLVKKGDSTWRPCGDYCCLNMITKPDHHSLPSMTDITSNLYATQIFSKLDLLKGYCQVPVLPDDIPKTAIVMLFGTYTFNYFFSLQNSGSTFQHLMDSILGDLDFYTCHVSDILIFSCNLQEHQRHLRTILDHLRDNDLVIKYRKCAFGASSIEFPSHHISPSSVHPLASKVNTVVNFPHPTFFKQFQEFVGIINYYH